MASPDPDLPPGTQAASEAVVPNVSEREMARYAVSLGRRVREHRGRHWEEVLPGFYRPVNAFARLAVQEATRPTWRSWGFQACLKDGDASAANAALPVHRITDLDAVAEQSLPSSRKYKLRRARRHVQFVALTRPDLLLDQGYRVFRSYQDRTSYGVRRTEQSFRANFAHFGERAHGLVLAGLIEGRMAGYVTGHAVDGTAYVREVVAASDALDTQISVGLEYEFFDACRRSAGVTEVIHGLHTPENEGLCRHKAWLGLTVDRIPARVGMAPGVASLMRQLQPYRLYRLTGQASLLRR